ncbi:EamA family transporter RarD [uncultured Roseobacter sp.]|uniref:EamA family transporter RarD n=1 Tax=uncultured Roseobacter sp. TaxID=114847 RepID=UPI0026207F8C|nr:EamA family transporter RarD [uncultured Roseobacter sp.]
MLSGPAKGVAAMVGACTVWGLSPMYYKMLSHIPAMEVLSHRMIWSLVFFGVVLGAQGRLGEVLQAMNTRRSFALVAVASVMIAANWALFIWSVQTGRTTQTSLGYYVYPLVAVVIGRVIFGEKLGSVQWLAVGLAAVAVVVLTVGLGTAPWIALTLALTFGLYGMIKKQLDVGPVVSVTTEVLLLVPFAVVILLQTYHNGGAVFGGDLTTMSLLVFAGPITALPLIMFSFAARRLAMTTVGLLQYINPTLQFACAVFVFSEPFGRWHLIAFVLIWTALAFYSVSALRQDNARRRAARAASASGTVL